MPPGYRPLVGEEVRVRLSDRGVAGLAEEIRSQEGSAVTGDVVEVDQRAMVLAVAVGSAGGPAQQTRRELRQRVVISVMDVVGLDLRQLDRRRTAVVVGGAVALLGAFAISEILGGFGGSTKPPGGPDPPEMTGSPAFFRR